MLYLELLHGRKDRNQDMDEMPIGRGFCGPVLKFDKVQLVYTSHLVVQDKSGDYQWFYADDLLYYDGAWYGEFLIYSKKPDSVRGLRKAQSFDPAKGREPQPTPAQIDPDDEQYMFNHVWPWR